MLLVPGTFACSTGTGAKLSLDEQQDQIVLELRLMYEWALETPQIAGFIPWHLSNRKMAARPDCDYGLGAVAMPRVMAELKKIGTLIKSGAPDKITNRCSETLFASCPAGGGKQLGGAGVVQCDACAGKHQVALKAAGCTASEVQMWCAVRG